MKDIKEQFFSDLSKIHFEMLTTTTPVDSSYDIDVNSIVIGITGSYGKTASTYILYNYLTEILNKKVTLLSSNFVFANSFKETFLKDGYANIENVEEYLPTFLYASAIDCADYIIIECNAEASFLGIYDNLAFDYKVLASFKNGYELHLPGQSYIEAKKHFFSNRPCRSIINYNADNIEEFISIINPNDLYLFDTGGNNLSNSNFSISDNVHVYPTFKLGGVGSGFFILNILNNLNTYDKELFLTSLSFNMGINNSIILIAILKCLDIYDAIQAKTFIQNIINTPGRCEDFQWNNRTFIIDPSNSAFIEKLWEEFSDPYYSWALQEYNDKYKTTFGLPDISIPTSHIKWLWSVQGAGFPYLTYKRFKQGLQLNGWLATSDLEARSCFLIFLANAYCLLNHLSTLPENIYSCVSEDISLSDILDHTAQTAISAEELLSIKTILNTAYSKTFTDEYDNAFYLTKNTFDADNSTSDHYQTIEGFGVLLQFNFNTLLPILNYFESLNNTALNTACAYVRHRKERIDILYPDRFAAAVDKWIGKVSIDKVYITPTSFEQSNNITPTLLERASQKVQTSFVTYRNRKAALRAIIEESQEGDLIIIGGRGLLNTYTFEDGGEDPFLDKDYIIEVINEIEENEITE